MCSGDRSSSANGAIALRQSAAAGWSTSSSSVLSLWTIRGPSVTGQAYGPPSVDLSRAPGHGHRDTATGTRPGLDRLDPRGGGLDRLDPRGGDSVPSVTEPLTVMFMPESAYGPTNQCIGLGKV